MLAADRIVGNFMEQTWSFLAAMWLYCLFVDMNTGSILGFSSAITIPSVQGFSILQRFALGTI